MRVINARGVNEAYTVGLNYLLSDGVRSSSRVGDVLVAPVPVTTVYQRPCERVLFNARRDANPFFHFMEGLWMLAGRNDVEWIERYNSTFKQFSDDGVIFNAAYGHRWRSHFKVDQLTSAIAHLKESPNSRRAVISMWDPYADFDAEGKDFPCNLNIAFRIQRGPSKDEKFLNWHVLDMTVFNRSNDIVWGAYGANAVHMSMLQEYMAANLGIGVGTYYQVSNNYHAYTDILEKVGKPDPHPLDPYDRGEVGYYPMITDPRTWDTDLQGFMNDPLTQRLYSNDFFYDVAQPMANAWAWYKDKRYLPALDAVDRIEATDWKLACGLWLKRRMEKHATRETQGGRRGQKTSHIADD